RTGRGEVVHDLGDGVGVRHRGVDPRLGLHDAARRDELHGPGDLLRRLDASDPSSEDPLLTARHLPSPPGPTARRPAWPMGTRGTSGVGDASRGGGHRYSVWRVLSDWASPGASASVAVGSAFAASRASVSIVAAN